MTTENATQVSESDKALQKAKEIGYAVGSNHAEWIIQDSWGGRATRNQSSSAKDILQKIEDCGLDFEIPTLSGVWVDGETPLSLFVKCTGMAWDSEDPDDILAEELCREWEIGVMEGLQDTLQKSATEFLESEEEDEKIALARFLEVEAKDLDEIEENSYDSYGLKTFSYGGNDYAVGNDSDCDDAWDQALDSYIEECLLPEIKDDNLRNYFDFEKWKRDARYDGRGHSLSSYDGNENEEEVDGTIYYIYKN